MKLATYQGGFSKGVEENINLMKQVIESSVSEQFDIITFTEVFVQGYLSGDYIKNNAFSQNSAIMSQICDIAAQFKIAIAFGYAESDEVDQSIIYDSCCFISKTGAILANYRKTHLWGDYEKSLFTPGKSLLAPFEYEGVKISLLVCFDIEFPEPARKLTSLGVDLIIVPTAHTGLQMTSIMVPTRALENQIFVVYTNRCGSDVTPDGTTIQYCGRSIICSPDGHNLAKASPTDPEIIHAVINPKDQKWEEARLRNPYLESRRLELY